MSSLTLAVNERAFDELVVGATNALSHVDPINFNGSLGPFSLDASIGFKITSGNVVDLTAAGTIVINKLELTYDPLVITFGIDIPTVRIGGECFDFGFFSFCLPEFDFFTSNPDVSIPIDLSGLVVSSYSGEFSISHSEQILAARAGMGNHQAHATADTTSEIQNRILMDLQATILNLLPASVLNSISSKLADLIKGNLADKQQFFLNEIRQNINLIDVGETVKNILNSIVDKVLDSILGWVPDVFKDIVKAILSPIIDLIGAVLDIPSDVTWWLEGLLGTNLGLFNTLLGFIEKLLGSIVPIYQFEDPYPIIEDSSGLIPVLIGIDNVTTVINDEEFIVSADIV